MPRITVAIFSDRPPAFDLHPYRDITGANILQYPEIPDAVLRDLLSAKPEEVERILK